MDSSNGFTSNNKDILGLTKGVYNVGVVDASDGNRSPYEVDGPDSPLSINYETSMLVVLVLMMERQQ